EPAFLMPTALSTRVNAAPPRDVIDVGGRDQRQRLPPALHLGGRGACNALYIRRCTLYPHRRCTPLHRCCTRVALCNVPSTTRVMMDSLTFSPPFDPSLLRLEESLTELGYQPARLPVQHLLWKRAGQSP